MGADPVQKLVLPRVLAATLGLPLLTLSAIVLGVLGGLVVADLQFQIAPTFFLQTVRTTVTPEDFFAGVAKTFVFGWIVAMVGCFVGLRTSGGTAGVGRATTRAVVAASILVLVSDYFLTRLLMLVPTDRLAALLTGWLA
jgi:phospholipid/cholesterol/gamma-HCH transport system permease protein